MLFIYSVLFVVGLGREGENIKLERHKKYFCQWFHIRNDMAGESDLCGK